MTNITIFIIIYSLILCINFVQSEKHIILVLNSFGLANRIRAISSWYGISKLSNRKLIISWEPSIECNVTFTSLFQKVPDNMFVLENPLTNKANGINIEQAINTIKNEALNNKLSFAILKDREEDDEDYKNEEIGMFAKGFNKKFIISQRLMLNGPDILLTNHNGVVSLAGIPCQLYNNYKTLFYDNIIPIDNVNNMVNHIYKTYFEHKIMIGVHIRMHDNNIDWAVVPPGGLRDSNPDDDKNKNEALFFGQGAEPQLFYNAMISINNQFKDTFGSYYNSNKNSSNDNDSGNDREVIGEPDTPVRFYICSNNQTVKMAFLRYFPDAVVLDGPLYRNNTEDIQFALTEWLLLRHSSLLLHTYGSSFAEEAASASKLTSGTALVGLWRGINILHKHASLPHCGNPLFFEAYGNDQGEIMSYTEDVKSKIRQVQGKLLNLKPCQGILDDWKIPNLHCFHSDSVVVS